MRIFTLTKIAVAACAFSAHFAVANLLPIQGDIAFQGNAQLNPVNKPWGLSMAKKYISITAHVDNDGTAGLGYSDSDNVTGSFLGIPNLTPVTFSPFTFEGGGKTLTPFVLWTFTNAGITYQFTATNDWVDTQTHSALSVDGTGWVQIFTTAGHVNLFRPTEGTFNLGDNYTVDGQVNHFTFESEAHVGESVPDTGSTILLIGLGVSALGAGLLARRRWSATA
jgi:hypothetical protein